MAKKMLYFAIINSCVWFIIGMMIMPMAKDVFRNFVTFAQIIWSF